MHAPYTKGLSQCNRAYVELGKLKKIFEKRKLLNIAMKSLLRTSGSVSSVSSGEYLPSSRTSIDADTQTKIDAFLRQMALCAPA